MSPVDLTKAQLAALKWLRNRGGTGIFERNRQVLIAQGERAGVTRSTWNSLRNNHYLNISDGGRVTLTPKGRFIDLEDVKESATA